MLVVVCVRQRAAGAGSAVGYDTDNESGERKCA